MCDESRPHGEGLPKSFGERKARNSALIQLNAAANANEAQIVLENETFKTQLGIDSTAYDSLAALAKIKVATDVWNTGTDYISVVQFKSAYDAAVAKQVAIAAINAATSATEVEAVLETAAHATALNINLGSPYSSLSAAEQAQIAADVWNGGADYALDQASNIKTAFDNALAAVTVRIAIEAINAATNATEAEAALETAAHATALNINLGSPYSSLSAAEQAQIAADVWNGGADYALDQASNIKTAFKNALAVQEAIAAVNAATDAFGVEEALEAYGRALNIESEFPSLYTSLSLANQEQIATAVWNNDINYAPDQAADIKAAFDNELAVVTVRVAIEAINFAYDPMEAEIALQMHSTALNIDVDTAYADLSDAAQAHIASVVWNNGADYGLDQAADIKAAFDNALAVQEAIAAINDADFWFEVRDALEAPANVEALNINVGAGSLYLYVSTEARKRIANVVWKDGADYAPDQAADIKAVFEDAAAVEEAKEALLMSGLSFNTSQGRTDDHPIIEKPVDHSNSSTYTYKVENFYNNDNGGSASVNSETGNIEITRDNTSEFWFDVIVTVTRGVVSDDETIRYTITVPTSGSVTGGH